jgi:hypothetical protein
MSIRSDILLALRGRTPERVPWNIHHDLLPQGTMERALRERGLGIIEKSVAPYRAASSRVAIEERTAWENGSKAIYQSYRTPVGELHCRHVIGPDGSSWVREYPVKGPQDFQTLAFLQEDARYLPNDDAVASRQRSLGDDGLLLGRMMRSPFQRLLTEWMGMEAVSYALADCPDEMDALVTRLAAADEPAFHCAASSPAEAIWSAENLTADLTSPDLFRRYCLPYYNRGAQILHAGGKLYGVHMDGKLGELKRPVAECDLDFIEGFTPPPMGNLSVSDARGAWPRKALWVNFPGSVLLGPEEEVLAFALALLASGWEAGSFLLTLTEEFADPPRSLRLIADAVRLFEERRNVKSAEG